MSKSMEEIEEQKLRWDRVRFLITAIGGSILFFIGLWQFAVTARNEFAKPVLEKQIELCMDATESAALLSQPSIRIGTKWKDSPLARKYRALYFGKLAIVEDKCLYRRMIDFKAAVFDGAESNVTSDRLAIRIGFACRRLLSKNWSSGLLQFYDPQNLFETFGDLEDYKKTMNLLPDCALKTNDGGPHAAAE